MVVTSAETEAGRSNKKYTGGFVDEMRSVAMKLHTKDQSKEGEKETRGLPWSKWEPNINGYLNFLMNCKLVFDTFEMILDNADFPANGELRSLRNTGLERAGNLAKDLEWFKKQGYSVPEPLSCGLDYSSYIEELSKKDQQAFICHLYNMYFGHTAGGLIIGKKVAAKILNGKELDFYKWDGDLSQILQNAREKLNRVTKNWTRDEKNHCLEETKIAFKFIGDIIRLNLA